VNAKQALDFSNGQSAQSALDQADAAAQTLKIDSTPSFTISKNGQQEKVVAVGLDSLTSKLDKAIAS